MLDESEREYHERRARAELDLAYRSESRKAMAAHLRLSSLHMAELRVTPRPVPARRLPGDREPAGVTAGRIGQSERQGEADLVSR